MGIPTWSHWLYAQGFCDKQQCCRQSLWRPDIQDERVSDRLALIPRGSELLFDGHNLCFHIHGVAYAKQASKSKKLRCMLPMFLPLQDLVELTHEFVNALRGADLKIRVFFDGEADYVLPNAAAGLPTSPGGGKILKEQTIGKRMSKRDDQWENLQSFISHGSIAKTSDGSCNCEYLDSLPLSGLFTSVIIHALITLGVNVTLCETEADAVLARHAVGDSRKFIVGRDSDFCFFRNVNYIPLESLAVYPVVTAVVIQRTLLAEHLQIPEALMVELAILLGNDYFDPSAAWFENVPAFGNGWNRQPDIIAFLQEQSADYRVQSASHDPILDFVRKFYNNEDLSAYPLEAGKPETPDRSEALEIDTTARSRPSYPAAIDTKLARLQPMKDSSIKQAVVRCLKDYVDRNDDTLIDSETLDVFDQFLVDDRTYADIDKELPRSWRPQWKDILAAYVIEATIRRSMVLSLRSPILKLFPPSSFFDQYKFHAHLYKLRHGAKLDAPPARAPAPPPVSPPPPPTPPPRLVLPVDEYETKILESVRRQRVTIIEGETGCGKSSRIPIMLMRANLFGPQDKLFISQPRRIAAKALVERLRNVEPDFRNEIALLMGHGHREYVNAKTRAWFVTTGYLVRLLANNPGKFDNVSYIIVDEVHERSVDTDILCLVCKRLLETNKNIRLILMSATMASTMYQEYFGVPEPPIKVGARRFPVREVYLEDMADTFKFHAKDAQKLEQLRWFCNQSRCAGTPSGAIVESLYVVVSRVATMVGRPGSSVLIFVPGMNDIVAISDLIEQQYTPGVKFVCFPVHSDIPFDDQMEVFNATKGHEVKIVIATNAAESSVTLPDVDHVICLGLCKQIIYNERSHRQVLVPTWISRASATQRAGRTGRVRPGTVYRMYSRENFEQHMESFEIGEMLRIPLDSVILRLKDMVGNDELVSATLQSCLEPPDMSTIDRSFKSLHEWSFISSPDDYCDLTTLGRFVSSLGLDLQLGSLIGLGIQFGVGAEAIQMAGVLSFPKQPWLMSNVLVHSPESFNATSTKTYSSRCHFDANLMSEPLAIMNMLWDYEHMPEKKRDKWCKFYGIYQPRLRRLQSTCSNLRTRVAEFIGIDKDVLEVARPPRVMANSMITVLRILQVWVFHQTMIQFDPSTVKVLKSGELYSLSLQAKSDQVQDVQLDGFLKKDRHPYNLTGFVAVRYNGRFDVVQRGEPADFPFVFGFEERLLSLASEKGFDQVHLTFVDYIVIFVQTAIANDLYGATANAVDSAMMTQHLSAVSSATKRRQGREERPAGLFDIIHGHGVGGAQDAGTRVVEWTKYSLRNDEPNFKRSKKLQNDLFKAPAKSLKVFLAWSAEATKDQFKKQQAFELTTRSSTEETLISDVDMKDLFAAPAVKASRSISREKQCITFPMLPSAPMRYPTDITETATTSWDRPMFQNIPEGARVLSVLASDSRREHFIRMPSIATDSDDGRSDDDEEEETYTTIFPDSATTKMLGRWRTSSGGCTVFVNPSAVPASALPVESDGKLYCASATTLEIASGGMRAEGLTMLPPGDLFFSLSMLAFGLPVKGKKIDEDRAHLATAFNEDSMGLGERLECFPERVEALLRVFEDVDGYDMAPWTDLYTNPLTAEKIVEHLRAKQQKKKMAQKYSAPPRLESPKPKEPSLPAAAKLHVHVLTTFAPSQLLECARLFATDSNGAVGPDYFPSSNILAMIVYRAKAALQLSSDAMSIESPEWTIESTQHEQRTWYRAKFSCDNLLNVPQSGKNVPAWMKVGTRPTEQRADLEACFPRRYAHTVVLRSVVDDADGTPTFIFGTMELAVRVEAACWLERQFFLNGLHWHEQMQIDAMVDRLVAAATKKKKPRWKQRKSKK